MDAYMRGLNGRQAAWAARKYRGHRTLPETILAELDEAGIVWEAPEGGTMLFLA